MWLKVALIDMQPGVNLISWPDFLINVGKPLQWLVGVLQL